MTNERHQQLVRLLNEHVVPQRFWPRATLAEEARRWNLNPAGSDDKPEYGASPARQAYEQYLRFMRMREAMMENSKRMFGSKESERTSEIPPVLARPRFS